MRLWRSHRNGREHKAEVAHLRDQLAEQGREIRKLREQVTQLRNERDQLLQAMEMIGTAVAVVKIGLER